MTRAEWDRLHPVQTVRTLGDVDPGERVWTRHAEWGETAHLRARSGVAVCGAGISEWPVLAGDLVVQGSLPCPGCWPTAREGD